jgi:23S rRNA pseudouridine1911/1915/1917 synthase
MAGSDGCAGNSAPGSDIEGLSFVVGPDLGGQRVDQALAELCGVPRAQVSRWITGGRVRVDGQTVERGSRRVREGHHLQAEPPEVAEARVIPEAIALDILFEDADLVVVDKRAGMVVHPAPGHASGTLVNALLHHCGSLPGVGGELRPGIVHRLDRGTSGVMVVAKNDFSHRVIAEQFHDHSIERIYRAAVRAVPTVGSGRVDRPIGRHLRDRKKMSVRSRSSRPAATRWRVIERFPGARVAWLEIHPETGRTHQIRVHLASIGLPVCGDPVYGRSRKRPYSGVAPILRPALHAAVLGFKHPRSGQTVRFESPLHADLADFLDRLRRGEEA